MGNHIKSGLMNQASSDSELTKFKTKLLLEAHGDLTDPDLHKDGSKGLFLPGVQNMKHNVSEKVAQVGTRSLSLWLSDKLSIFLPSLSLCLSHKLHLSLPSLSLCISHKLCLFLPLSLS